MLNRVKPTVINVDIQVAFVEDGVFPITTLPDPALGSCRTDWDRRPDLWDGVRKPRFDAPPAGRKVSISGGKCPERVQMIGQNHHGVNLERVVAFGAADGVA